MNIKEIKELIELIQESAVEEFEMEDSGVRVWIRKSPDQRRGPEVGTPAPSSSVAAGAVPEPPQEEIAEEEFHVFAAPIVGTFYITPKPDAEPFVRIGDQVTKSSVLCIIEAMKIFNQIECDVEGEIVSILVENGQPVEYGEPLFEIRLSTE
jgi:acetyl-CoA carboxylase biotin carboxyl carrier protein